MKKLLLALLLVSAVFSTRAESQIKYVILFIGDGFGLAERQLVEAYLDRPLAMSEMTASTLTGTDNVLGKTTDSAASGTAFACGVKTVNGAIGVSPRLKPLESIARRLKKSCGFKVGLVSSSPLNDATPAVFYAREASRGNADAITRQIPSLPVDYLSGAKLKGHHDPSCKELAQKGYAVLSGADALDQVAPGVNTYAVLQPFTRWGFDGEIPAPTLADHTRKAIEFLDNPKGFFLMVENGHTDYAGHSNDSGKLVREAIELENAVKAGLDFLAAHPDETLIIYTSDHETGGLNIDGMKKENLSLLALQQLPLDDIAKELQNAGLPTFEESLNFIQGRLGLDAQPFTETEKQRIRERAGIKHESMYGSYNGLVSAAAAARDERCGIKYTTHGHSNAKVVTNASGAQAELFREAKENSDIPHLIKFAVLGESEPELNAEMRLAALLEKRFCRPENAAGAVAPRIAGAESRRTEIAGTAIEYTSPDSLETEVFYDEDSDVYAVKLRNASALCSLRFTLPELPLPDPTWFFGWFGDPDFYLYDAANFIDYGKVRILPEFEIEPSGNMLLILSPDPLPEMAAAFRFKPISSQNQRNRIEIVHAASPIGIDGELNEEAWRKAAFHRFLDRNGQTPAESAECALLVDPEHNTLYLAVRLTDDDIVCGETRRDGALWRDDCIDLHLSAAADDVVQYIVNADGVFYDARNQNSSFDSSKVELAARRIPGGWVLEMALPLSELKISSGLSGNIARQHRPEHSMSGLFPPGSSLHDRAFWGEFVLPETASGR